MTTLPFGLWLAIVSVRSHERGYRTAFSSISPPSFVYIFSTLSKENCMAISSDSPMGKIWSVSPIRRYSPGERWVSSVCSYPASISSEKNDVKSTFSPTVSFRAPDCNSRNDGTCISQVARSKIATPSPLRIRMNDAMSSAVGSSENETRYGSHPKNPSQWRRPSHFSWSSVTRIAGFFTDSRI